MQHVSCSTRPPPCTAPLVCATLIVGLLELGSAHLARADEVVLQPRPDDPGRIVLAGRVLDYSGAGLVMETAAGERQTVPSKQVVEIRTVWPSQRAIADDHWRRRDFVAASASYESAVVAEARPWARRVLQARVVAALRELRRWDAAGERFLELVRDDPATPQFDVIPLAWTAAAPSVAAEAKARTWLADRSSNVAGLLGASLLLSTSSRVDALRRLRELALDGDARIARLAEAQLWRTAAVTADAAQIADWQRAIEKLPEPLRAGPYLVVGRAWGTRNEPELAALLLLRVPILYDDQPYLASEALWSAGQMLERLGQPAEAAGVYRELVRDHATAAMAAGAADRLRELRPNAP